MGTQRQRVVGCIAWLGLGRVLMEKLLCLLKRRCGIVCSSLADRAPILNVRFRLVSRSGNIENVSMIVPAKLETLLWLPSYYDPIE